MLITVILAIIGSSGLWALIQYAVQTHGRKKSAEMKLLMGLAYSEIINRAERRVVCRKRIQERL